MALSTRIDTLEAFYRGGIAGYLDILFFPMTAVMVLGVGYVRERLDSFIGQGDGVPLSDEEVFGKSMSGWWRDRALSPIHSTPDLDRSGSATLRTH